jgi:glycosyltransferase involved in cell wall biosynthesis
MRLVVLSSKECWVDPTSPSGYATVGGFPFQMQAISELFDQTTLMVPIRTTPLPMGARPLIGHNLQVYPLEEPTGDDLRRKIALITWLPRNLPRLWQAVQQADAVHAPVPGDIGTIGILVALAQRKPLFVRHCGNWRHPATIAERFLQWLLERIAGGPNVVMATGGGDSPPSPRNPNINWIFSTTLTEEELSAIPFRKPWRTDQPLKLVTVGRLTLWKNVQAIVRALPLVRSSYPQVSLDVVGDGPYAPDLKKVAAELGMTRCVTFHGNVSHEKVIKILAEAHVFVFPTQGEGFPKVVLEALACGLPVIATEVSVIPHLIGKRSGILLHRTDPDAIAKAILQLVAAEKRLAEMSASARQTSREYTLERWRDVIGERLRSSWGPLSATEPEVERTSPSLDRKPATTDTVFR